MLRIAVAGNPNVGKTSLFNCLTGSRYKVANYPGVTVETREGRLKTKSGTNPDVCLVDLPGTYSLTPTSEDERIAFQALTQTDENPIHGVLVVLDAANLRRNLYFALQVLEFNFPCIIALNMSDLARNAGILISPKKLSQALHVPVIATSAQTGEGISELSTALIELSKHEEVDERDCSPFRRLNDSSEFRSEVLDECMSHFEGVCNSTRALWLVLGSAAGQLDLCDATPEEQQVIAQIPRTTLDSVAREHIIRRYDFVDRILDKLNDLEEGHASPRQEPKVAVSRAMERSRKIDRVLTHHIWGPLIFVGVMVIVFQSIFSWSDPLMTVIELLIGWTSSTAQKLFGAGLFTDLLTEGVIAGVGNVLVFIPQIAFLFLFIGLLEDSGYMARAAFIIDRVMSRVGLSGRSFVPLLSGFACAIPAIMGTRAIPRFRDRLATMLMIPFVSCSARLPIYALIIGTFFDSEESLLGPLDVGGLLLVGMYGLSLVSALAIGALFKRTILRAPVPPLVLELPPYRLPRVGNTVRQVADKTWQFVHDAGTIILAITVILWALLTFPRVEPSQLAEGESAIEHSLGGKIGKFIEPALEPIGQDWRVGVGILGSFAAREVLVSTLGLVYGIEEDVGLDEDATPLREAIRSAKDPATGQARYSPLKGLALMIFFVYASQCMSTLAVLKRETHGWKWPMFSLVSMSVIAYVAALIVFQGGRLLGFY